MMNVHGIIFDAYGTLFDVYGIARRAETIFPGRGAALAELWRDRQIDYTRLRSLSGMYKPFWELTQDALIFACRKLALDLTLDARITLMGEYARLPAFPENLAVLKALQDQGLKLAVLSNANPQMLDGVIDGAGMRPLFSHLLSADTVGKFKTAPEVYQLGTDVFGQPARTLLFVSSNCWDVCGAAWFGHPTFWVNRTGAPLEELGVTPTATGTSLNDLLQFVLQQSPDE